LSSKLSVTTYYVETNNIRYNELRLSLLLRCLNNYLCRHPCIHLHIYYSSIYRPVLSSLPTWLFQFTKYLIISHPTKWHTTPTFYYTKEEHFSHVETNNSRYIHWTKHMIWSATQLCSQPLLPAKCIISYLHYSHRRSNNIYNIDELRPLLLVRCQQHLLSLTFIHSTATEDVVTSIA
jgi:hypothetical protein